MKKLLSLFVLAAFAITIYAQEIDSTRIEPIQKIEKDSSILIDSSTKINDDESIVAKSDTTKLKVGNVGLKIIETDLETKINIMNDELKELKSLKFDNNTRYRSNRHKTTKRSRFEGHFAAFEFGVNNFMNPDFTYTPKPENDYLNLMTGKSFNVNINFAQYSIGLIDDNVGLVTGLGFEFNDYKFEGNTSITVENGITVPDSSYIQAGIDPSLSKLTMGYFTIPLILEFQVHIRYSTIYLSGGIIGGVKMGSHTKVEYMVNNEENVDKQYKDFNINPFRYELTARVGINNLGIYALYSPVPLFEENRGPVIHPFSLGLQFNFQ